MANYNDLRLESINDLPDEGVDSDGDKTGYSKADKQKMLDKVQFDNTYNYAQLMQKIACYEMDLIDNQARLKGLKSGERLCYSTIISASENVERIEKTLAYWKALSLELFVK